MTFDVVGQKNAVTQWSTQIPALTTGSPLCKSERVCVCVRLTAGNEIDMMMLLLRLLALQLYW